MSEESGQEKTFDATPRKLEQARARGDVPMSREGSAFGVYAGALIAVGLAGGLIASQFTSILTPMVEQSSDYLDLTAQGYQRAGNAVLGAMAIALVPLFGLMIAGALLPHLAQNSIVVATERIRPKFSHLSPSSGVKRIIGLKALFEFGKSLLKAVAVGAACWVVGLPLYESSGNLAAVDPSAFLSLATEATVAVLFAVTLVAGVVAMVDVSFQQFDYRRRHRMSLQELREEMRSTEGDPHVKAQRRKLQRKRSQRRMLAEVPRATVVITNPTHFAVALRYRRGEDDAPMCVAKGADQVALRIREAATAAGVPIIEEKPLARALFATVEIDDVIPQAHFEAVAKIIGLIWGQQAMRQSSGEPKPAQAASSRTPS